MNARKTSRLKQGIAIALLVVSTVGACGDGCDVTEDRPFDGTEIRDATTGMAFRLPEGFRHEATPDRIVIRSAVPIRQIRNISLWKSGAPPEGRWDKRACVGRWVFDYRVEKANGGSGGTEFRVIAHAATDQGSLNAAFHTQRELHFGDPTFGLFWRFLAGVRVADE